MASPCTLEYSGPNHVHAVSKVNGVDQVYDANGNPSAPLRAGMMLRVVDGDTYEQDWDAENRLVQVKKNSNVVASYVYDGDGNRVQATVNGTTTAYVGNYFEWSGSPSTIVKYYYAGAQRIAMRQGAVVYFLLGDHLGSTAMTLDGSGSKTAELRYKAYGETRYTWGATPTDFRFTGQRYDSYIQLAVMGARWYDGQLGRWSTPDSIVPDPVNPQSFNRYSWVRNNPLRYVDPTGHKEEGECGFWGEACSDDPPLLPPLDDPFWDEVSSVWRHLVESCHWTECSAAAFNAYTPGEWSFWAADNWHTATSEVYNVGPISEADARRAAQGGHPNPVEDEQYREGLEQRPNRSFPAETYQMLSQQWWLPYQYFYDELEWTTVDMGRMRNFEPRYLETLVANHPRMVERAYLRAVREYEEDNEMFMLRMNPWDLFGGGK